MDEAELAARTARLPDAFVDRLPLDALQAVWVMAEGGEWGEMLDLLLAVLSQTDAAVTVAERAELRQVLTGWGLPVAEVDDLPTQP
jgi:hypothetical protein